MEKRRHDTVVVRIRCHRTVTVRLLLILTVTVQIWIYVGLIVVHTVVVRFR